MKGAYFWMLLFILNGLVIVGIVMSLDFLPFVVLLVALGCVGNFLFFMNREKIQKSLDRAMGEG